MSRPGIEPRTSRSPERTLYLLSYRGRYLNRIRTLVAMVTYSCHWNKKNDIYCYHAAGILTKVLQKCWVVLYHTYHFCPNLWICLVSMATEKLNLRNYWKIFSSEARRGIKLNLCRNVHNISLYKNGFFIAVVHVLSLLWQHKFSIDL